MPRNRNAFTRFRTLASQSGGSPPPPPVETYRVITNDGTTVATADAVVTFVH
jgi:hypothetical protein